MTSSRLGMRTVRIAIILVALVVLPACFKVGTPPVGGAVTIELSSPAQTFPLSPGVATTITATVYDQSNQGVTWTISPLNFGALSNQTSTSDTSSSQTLATITYTAPKSFSTNTTVTITATSITNPGVTASVPIKVLPLIVSLETVLPLTGNSAPAAAQTIAPGQILTLTGAVLPLAVTSEGVSWTLSPADAGSLTGETTGSANYVAPTVVSSPLTATVTATAIADSNAKASVQITVLPSGAASNVIVANVNGGPIPPQIHPNAAFTSVTICNPGSSSSSSPACQTVDGILIDTGSYGLRILQTEIPSLSLTTFVDGNGNTLENCAANVDGSYLWGPVAQADLYIGGETTVFTSPLPVQVISSANVIVPNSCSNGGTENLNTPQLLGANGILGIGPEPTDCTLNGVNLCDGTSKAALPNIYYTCPKVGCATTDSPVIVQPIQQVTNPVLFLTNTSTFLPDNNGTILQLPSVSGVESSVSGTLTFGIGTESNNALGTANVLTLDATDHFTTNFKGQTLTKSFIDSGANALLFPDSLPACTNNPRFFCPPAEISGLSAEMTGATQGQSTVTFNIDNGDDLLSANPSSAAFSNLAGPQGTYQSCTSGDASCVFNWGLPFFYGRSVYTHLDACLPPPALCAPLSAAWFAF